MDMIEKQLKSKTNENYFRGWRQRYQPLNSEKIPGK